MRSAIASIASAMRGNAVWTASATLRSSSFITATRSCVDIASRSTVRGLVVSLVSAARSGLVMTGRREYSSARSCPLMSLGPLDLTIVLGYVTAMIAVGCWVGRGTAGAADYLLGSRNLPWWALLLSIVATETSTVTFLSTPGIAYGGGLPGATGDFRFLQLPIGYVIGRLVVVRWLLPLYFRGQVFTAYQVLAERFGGTVRKLASVLFLVTRTLADGLRLYLTALVVQALLPISLEAAVAAMGAVTIVYTYFGGMKAVVWTDVLQFAVYMAGAIVALFVVIAGLPGGLHELTELASRPERARLFDFSLALDNPYTFWAGLVGGAVLSVGSHGVDQIIVQRYLAAKTQQQAGLALSLSGVV